MCRFYLKFVDKNEMTENFDGKILEIVQFISTS